MVVTSLPFLIYRNSLWEALLKNISIQKFCIQLFSKKCSHKYTYYLYILLQILEKECPRTSRETVRRILYISFPNVRKNRRSHTITGIAIYVLEIRVSIMISVIDTIWLSMFRRKFLFFYVARLFISWRAYQNISLDRSSLVTFIFSFAVVQYMLVDRRFAPYEISRPSLFLDLSTFSFLHAH